MTQILSGICSEGIMVATDSMATSFDEDGKEHYFPVDKLFSVGSHAFIVSGGMGISVELSVRFKRYAEERQLLGIEEIKAAVGPYISDQYREVLRDGSGRTVINGELDRIYFVVGGYSFRSQEKPYQLALWGSEAGQLPLQRIQIGPSLAVPRTMSGEMRLFQMCQRNCQLPELVEFAEEFLQKQSEVNPQIGPPFRLGTVAASGFTRLERDHKPAENGTR
ncbi:MAG: hypothetical protein V3U56_03955 [Syntrophobacteria bacterium]